MVEFKLDCELDDDDDYPTLAYLQSIREGLAEINKEMPVNFREHYEHIIWQISNCFPACGNLEYDDTRDTWEISTGGWSGCEAIVAELRANHIFWSLCWESSHRGGKHCLSLK